MSATASLGVTTLDVVPGTDATCEIKVRNTGEIVEAYNFEILGDSAAWASVEPAELSLFPGTEGTARVHFHPPKSHDVLAGAVPFGVRVVPTQRPGEAVVPEGMVEVRPFADTTVELLPRTSHGRFSGKHELAIDNRGNAPLPVAVSAADPDQMLRFDLVPAELLVEPGQAGFTKIKVRPVNRRWRGTSETRPFQALVVPEGAAPIVVDGTMLHEPILPRWTVKALVIAAAAIVGLTLLWLGVFQPALKSAARDAVAAPVAEAKKAADASNAQAKVAQNAAAKVDPKAAAAAAEAAKNAAAGAGGAGAAAAGNGITTAPIFGPAGGNPFNQRVTVAATQGNTGTSSFVVPKGQALTITDLVLQNPQGDVGDLTLLRADQALFGEALQNYRDLDYHFVTPIVVPEGKPVTLQVKCTTSTAPDKTCRSAVYLGGAMGAAAKK